MAGDESAEVDAFAIGVVDAAADADAVAVRKHMCGFVGEG